jgi:ABC-2 type transport system permease protein
MTLWNDQVRAILAAQYRVIANRAGGAGNGRIVYWCLTGLWYLAVAALAVLVAWFIPEIRTRDELGRWLSGGLLLAFLFWQVVPVALATTGMSLELRRLLVYPIPVSSLFAIEALLRASTGVEVLIVMAGGVAGLMLSPIAPWWAPLVFLPYVAFNLLLSAGIRDLLTRLLARRGVRELVVLVIVMVSALPSLLVTLIPPETWQSRYAEWGGKVPAVPFPWSVTARLAAGEFSLAAAAGLIGWTVLAAAFGYSQFQRGLRWDADEVRARQRQTAPHAFAGWAEVFYRLPSRVLPDPLAALVEKEIRFLSRAPRFRLVFFMGFSFGIVIWMPIMLRSGRQEGFMGQNFLVMVSLYAALLLGEVLFWNSFGFDRMAAQAYYVMPVRISTVLLAKNIAAVFFLVLEVGIITCVLIALRVRTVVDKIPESFAVTCLLALFLLAVGNLASTHYPRPVDPAQSWRHSNSGRVQAMMLLIYPAIALPISLAYLARYAFDSNLAFYVVLGFGFVIGAITYSVALETAVEAADKRRESILLALSRGEGPIG